MKVASFFAGIGGFDYAAEQLGLPIVFQCEINKFCQTVLKKHWRDIPFIDDINLITSDSIPTDTDLWCAGFPCQDVSLANQGKRKGLNGERSGLFYKFAELVSTGQPRWLLIENVPGLLNSHKGEDFRRLLSRLDELGYGVSWRVFDAKYFGTPQRRRRVYIVASLGTLLSSKVLFDTDPIEVTPRSSLSKGNASTSGYEPVIQKTNCYSIQHAGIGRKPSAGPQAKGYRCDGETYTLDSRGSADAVCQTTAAFGVRNITGISEGMDGNRYRAIGNAVCTYVAKWIMKRIIIYDSYYD